MVVVSHPDAFERVLASHWRNYPKGKFYSPSRDFVGQGLATMDGDQWRERRRLLQPYFHRAELVKVVETMVAVVVRYLGDLRKRYPEGGEIDVESMMVDLTLDVVGTALFGRGVMQDGELSHETLARCTEAMMFRLQHPVPLWIPTRTNRAFLRIRGAVDEALYSAIGRARRRPRKDDRRPKTLLDNLIDARDHDGNPLRDQELRNEVATLIVAGHETTALTMTWMFVLLSGQDDVMSKLRAEVDATVGDRLPSHGDLSTLTYTRQVIQETLRLRGPVPFLPRTPVEDDNLCGYQVHAGEMVMLFFWGLHHHPDYWPDAEVFDPDRFSLEEVAARDSWSYLPFNAGPRTCIGSGFAMLEAQLITALMVQQTTWELVSKPNVSFSKLGTLRPAENVRIRFRWR